MTSTSNFFTAEDRSEAEDDGMEFQFRSSLKGFFTGRQKKENQEDSTDSSDMLSSTIVEPTDADHIKRRNRNVGLLFQSKEDVMTGDISSLTSIFKASNDQFRKTVNI